MHLAGIQEEKGKGFWVTILCMDRMQVAKKYLLKKRCFFEDALDGNLLRVMEDIRNDRSFWEKKKQFSQIRRPPKWVDVPPRLMFRPDGGTVSESRLEMFRTLPFDLGAVLVKERFSAENRFPFLQEADEEALASLLDAVFEEKRLNFGEEEMPERGSFDFYSCCAALWGGEKVWRMVRYGG